jgi:GT2 family glycosyltransferase
VPEPFISVIIPTYNRPERLRRCLDALCETTYPPDRFEVVVVDDGSREPVDAVVDAVRDRLDVRLVRQANAGPASARNAGAAVAHGEFLAFTDDDCRPAPGWLDSLAGAHADTPEALLGGWTENALPENPYARVSQHLVSYLYGYYNERGGGASFFTSNNFAVPAEAFRRLGGFDTAFPLAAGEDREFCDRWREGGLPLRYVPEAVVHHEHAMALRGFWRQHFHYGRGAFHFHQARSSRGDGRIAPEPVRFYADLLRYPFVVSSGPSAVRDAVLMAVTQVANVLGYFYERARS